MSHADKTAVYASVDELRNFSHGTRRITYQEEQKFATNISLRYSLSMTSEKMPCQSGGCAYINSRSDSWADHDKELCSAWASILPECGVELGPGECPYPAMILENARSLNDPAIAKEIGLGDFIGQYGIGVDERPEDLLE